MSVSARTNRSGAEYVIRQTIEARSKEVEMPQETCRNGCAKAKSGGDKADQGEEGADKCEREREKVTESYF